MYDIVPEDLENKTARHRIVLDKEGHIRDTDLVPMKKFPLHVFPSLFNDIVENIADAQQVDPEVVAMMAMTILSSAIGNSVCISPKNGWETPLFIWFIIVAESGYGKSPCLSILLEPLQKNQGLAYKKFKAELKFYDEHKRKESKNNIEASMEKPVCRHYIVEDHTIEALVRVFEDDPRGILVSCDEISGLIAGMNQYKAKGNDLQHYLSLFNCKPLKLDRKYETCNVANTGAAIIGGIQPSVFPEILDKNLLKNGFVSRFILLNAGEKVSTFSREGISNDTREIWQVLLREAYRLPIKVNDWGKVIPKVLILKDDALDFFESFYNELSLLEPYLSDCSKVFLPKIKSYYSLKFIGLLNCLCSFCNGSEINPVVSLEQTEAGIELARFFVSQAINTIELYSPETRKLSELQTNLIRVLHLLGNNVKDGRLYFEPIVRKLNKITPFCVEGKALGSLIKGLGLTTDYGTGHRSYVLYEDRKIDTLFKRVITKRTRELT